MSTQSHSPWIDPNVKAALAEGREIREINLICCPDCGDYSYFNEGSHWACQWCDSHLCGRLLDRHIDSFEVITLEDYIETEANPDGP